MKVERKHDYSIPGYGTVMFVKARRESDGANVELYRDYRGMWKDLESQDVRDARADLEKHPRPESPQSADDWKRFEEHRSADVVEQASCSRARCDAPQHEVGF